MFVNSEVGLRETLASERQFLAALIAGIPCGVFWKNAAGVYLGCNERFAQAAGFASAEEVVGRTDWELTALADQAERFREDDLQVLATGGARQGFEVAFRGSDDHLRHFVMGKTVLPMGDATGRGILGVLTEVTAIRNVEEQLAQAQKLESIGQLATRIAHEINTPMQCVGGNVDRCCGLCLPLACRPVD